MKQFCSVNSVWREEHAHALLEGHGFGGNIYQNVECTLSTSVQFSSVQPLNLTLCDPMECSTPGFPVHHQLPELLVHRISDAIRPSHPCHPLLFPPSIFPSIRVFSNESVLCIRWSKYWSFSFSISPSNEYSRLIFFRMDWLDLPAVQGTLKSLLQHHSPKASILRHSAFWTISPTLKSMHDYWKTIALTRRTFIWQTNLSAF